MLALVHHLDTEELEMEDDLEIMLALAQHPHGWRCLHLYQDA